MFLLKLNQGLHCLFDWCLSVQTVTVIQVNEWHSKAAEWFWAGLDDIFEGWMSWQQSSHFWRFCWQILLRGIYCHTFQDLPWTTFQEALHCCCIYWLYFKKVVSQEAPFVIERFKEMKQVYWYLRKSLQAHTPCPIEQVFHCQAWVCCKMHLSPLSLNQGKGCRGRTAQSYILEE